jgi:hypothetical protein
MADLMRNDFLTLNHYHIVCGGYRRKRISTFFLPKSILASRWINPVASSLKCSRFPSFKSLNCQPFPDFIDSHKSWLQLETVCLFTTASEIKNLVINGSRKEEEILASSTQSSLCTKSLSQIKKFLFHSRVGGYICTHTQCVCKIAWLSVGRRGSYWLHLSCSGRDQCFYIRNKGGFVSKNQPDCHKSERDEKVKKNGK